MSYTQDQLPDGLDALTTLDNTDVFIIGDQSDNDRAKKITKANLVTDLETALNHDNLAGFVANEHIDHTTVSITAGVGLTGGGTIAATRNIDLDISTLTDDASPSGSDEIALHNGSAMRKSDLTTAVDNAGATMNSDTNVGGNDWVLQDADSDAADDTKVGSWTKTRNYIAGQLAGATREAYRDLADNDVIKPVNDNGTIKYDKLVGVGTPIEQTGSYVSSDGDLVGYKLDDTRIAMLDTVSSGGGGGYRVWDIENNTISSILSGADNVSGSQFSRSHITAVDTNKFVHFNWSATTSGADTTLLEAKAVQLNTGTSVTAGSSTTLESNITSISSAAHGEKALWADQLATNKFIAVYRNWSNGLRAVVGTVSGTTITAGTPITLGAFNVGAGASVVAIDTDRAVIARYDGANTISLDMITVSGTTITDNGETSVTTQILDDVQPGMCKTGTNKFALVTTNQGSQTEVTIFSVSGTTITEEDSIVLSSSSTVEARCFMVYDLLLVEQGTNQWVFSVANDTLTQVASTTSLTYGSNNYNNKVVLDNIPYTVQSINSTTDTLRAVPQMVDIQFAAGIVNGAVSQGADATPALEITGLSNIAVGALYYPANDGNGVDTNATLLGIDKIRKFQGTSTTSVNSIV